MKIDLMPKGKWFVLAVFVLTVLAFYCLLHGGENEQLKHWAPVGNLQGGDVFSLLDDQGDLYVGGYHGGVFKKKLGEDHWVNQSVGLPQGVAISQIIKFGHQFYASAGRKIFCWDDTKMGWEDFTEGLPPGTVLHLVLSPSALYALIYGGDIFRLRPNETRWGPTGFISHPSENDHEPLSFSAVGEDLYVFFKNKGVVKFAKGSNLIFEETEGLTPGIEGFIPGKINMDSDGSDLFMSIDSVGLFRLPKESKKWKKINEGIPETGFGRKAIYSIYLFGSDIYAIADGSTLSQSQIYHFNRESDKWAPVTKEAPERINTFILSNGQFFIGSEKGIYRFSQDEKRWNFDSSDLKMVRVDHLVSISSSLYALSGKNIYRNAEGSEQWSLLQSYRGVSVLSATSLNEELFLGTAGGGVFECNKDNKECMPLNDGLLKGDRYITAMSTSENTLYAAVYPEGVFRFNSALMQWSAVGSGLPSEKISALAVREGEIFAAILGDVFSLKKGGTTWEAKSEGLMGKTQVENLIVASGNLYAGTDIGVFKWMVAKQQWKIENQNLNLSNRKAFPAKTSNWFASRIHPQKEVALSISFAPTDFNFNSVESMAEKDNDLYVAIEGRVFLHGHQSQKWIPLEKGLEGVYVYSLTTDKKSVFAGTNFGVYKLSD